MLNLLKKIKKQINSLIILKLKKYSTVLNILIDLAKNVFNIIKLSTTIKKIKLLNSELFLVISKLNIFLLI
jgi:hypothetical protein